MAQFARKNLYGFAAFAAASLAFCFTAAGCSDDTSTPDPFALNRGTVTYNYTKAVAKAAELPAGAVKAYYTFSNDDAFVYAAEVDIDAITEAERQVGESVERAVTIDQVPIEANKVSVMYFSAEGIPVGIGVDTLNWIKATDGTSAAAVEEPDFTDSELIAAGVGSDIVTFKVTTSVPCVDKGNNVWVKPILSYTNSLGRYVSFDLTAFATYDLHKTHADQPTYLEEESYKGYTLNVSPSFGGDEVVDNGGTDEGGGEAKIAAKVSSAQTTPGYYHAVEYGQQQITVSLENLQALGDFSESKIVYISDATLKNIEISGEKDVYVVVPEYDFGQESVFVDGVGLEDIPFYTATFEAVGNYVGTKGPSFTEEASKYVRWSLSSDEDVTYAQDAQGRLVVTSQAASLKNIVVYAESSSDKDQVTLHSLPSQSKLKISMATQVPVGGVTTGTIDSYFVVATESGDVEATGANLSTEGYRRVKLLTPASTMALSAPTLAKNENGDGIVFTLDKEEEGTSVSLGATYTDRTKGFSASTDPFTVQVIASPTEE
ncbi:MAG: hypothetical protein ACI38Q_06000 [Candidatus Bruticola sp.]